MSIHISTLVQQECVVDEKAAHSKREEISQVNRRYKSSESMI
jgi:hypothetical protein